MLSFDLSAFDEAGCSIVVGIASQNGCAHATRGWTLVIEDEGSIATVTLPAKDSSSFAYGFDELVGTTIAVTIADVASLEALQVKGPINAFREPTDTDRAEIDRHTQAFMDGVLRVDNMESAVIQRLIPDDFVICEFVVSEAYVQTPGPDAGRVLKAAST